MLIGTVLIDSLKFKSYEKDLHVVFGLFNVKYCASTIF